MQKMSQTLDLTRQYLPSLSEEQYAKLDVIADSLVETNRVLNLTSLTSPEEIALLHFYDSLTLLQTGLFTEGKTVLDVGTGGGFPSLPLAACTGCKVTANDATEKKLHFVAETAKKAGIENLTTLCGRAEELGKNASYREKFDIVVSRGVARMNILCEWCMPFVKKGGYFIAMKGNHGKEELDEAAHAVSVLGGKIEKVINLSIPVFDRTPTLLLIQKTQDTPADYPRSNGRIQKKPL